MCDTCVVLPSASLNQKMWFAKNSDRHPNEPNLILSKPALTHDLNKNPNVEMTYISIPQVEQTYSFTMIKPVWTWGCEMGVNSHNLCIGNEAVFTKGSYPKTGIIGMDICRLVLERCSTALEGMQLIATLIENYEQGGNCGFGEDFYYDNSFLVADSSEAFVVETSGNQWIAKRTEEVHAISNGFTIEGEWDFSCSSLEEYNGKMNFAKKNSDAIRTRFAGGGLRRYSIYSNLMNARDGKAKVTIYSIILGKDFVTRDKPEGIKYDTFKQALRFHLPKGGYTESPCMHYGGAFGSHTTGSLICCPEDNFIALSGGSTPCRSIYMPFNLSQPLPFSDDELQAEIYWLQHELIQRNLLAGRINESEYMTELSKVEAELDQVYHENSSNASINTTIYEMENEFIQRCLLSCSYTLAELTPQKGGYFYKKRWNAVNEALLDRIKELGFFE